MLSGCGDFLASPPTGLAEPGNPDITTADSHPLTTHTESESVTHLDPAEKLDSSSTSETSRFEQ